MLKNYLLVALRTLGRERLYAAINVLGLSLGLTVCLLVFAYVKHELSYDRFHEHADRLHRINYLIPEKGGILRPSAGTAFVLAPILREQVLEIEATVAMADIPEAIVRHKSASFREPVQFADSQFFSVFTFPLLQGNAESALQEPNSVVLSERLAAKYFGAEPPLGQQLSIEVRGKVEAYTVTGVCRNVPGNSSIDFDLLIPLRKLYSLYGDDFEFGWNLTWPSTYALLRPDASPTTVNAKLAALARELPIDNSGKTKILLGLQPISEVHFDHEIENAPTTVGNPRYLLILAGIAAVVLILACINFTTLAVGRSQTRTKETGIRKVLGARPAQLLGRFLSEAAVLCTLATITAFMLAELALPAFNELSGKSIERGSLLDSTTAAGAVILIVLTSLLAGGYPALVLARTRLRDTVRGRATLLTGGGLTRALVILQFGLSIALIVSTLVMSSQLRYLQTVPIGFDKEHLLLVKIAGRSDEKLRLVQLLRNDLAANPDILSISAAGRSFDGSGMANSDYLPDSMLFTAYFNPADEHFVATMGLTIIEGTNFTGSTLPDSLEPLLVNETLVRTMGWTSALGQKVPGLNGGRIIGVVNDFHYRSLTAPIDPLVIPFANPGNWSGNVRYAYIRIKNENLPRTVAAVRDAWNRVTPQLPFDYQFMDDHIDAQYRFEHRWWKVVGYASGMAVLVACFGAFGLTSLAVARRRKEIGIRKVLGASGSQIVGLLNREFVWLVVAGNLLAWPAAYYVAQRWLDTFAYRITLSVWPFLLGAAVTLIVVILTVSVQAVRAVLTNPVESLRYE